jgi:radical SAM protein with 4Fe4S-binding SPASM domain
MYPCHRYAEMQAFRIGDVFTGPDKELVKAYYRKLNERSTSSCNDCWIRDYCGGGCAWLLSDEEGVIHDPTEDECNRRRASFERGLWMRKQLRQHAPQWLGRRNEVASLDQWSWEPTHSEVSSTITNCV